MNKFKQWLNHARESFLAGLSGEMPPVQSTGFQRVLLIVRDVILVGVEAILTVVCAMTWIVISDHIVKVALGVAILISALRTYAMGHRLWNSLFLPKPSA